MSKAKIKWNSDKMLSISAMSISFITLIIFVYQTNLMRKQNYLSILPYLTISRSDNKGEHIFKLDLENFGVGPAIIESVTMTYKGKKYDLADYEDYLYTFLAAQVPALDSIQNVSSSTLDKGLAIPANYEYNILSIGNSDEDYQLIVSSLNQLLADGLTYQIIYKSIQNERWLIHNHSQGPKKLR